MSFQTLILAISIALLLPTLYEEFTAHYHMFYRRVGMDRFYLFTDYTVFVGTVDGIKIFCHRPIP